MVFQKLSIVFKVNFLRFSHEVEIRKKVEKGVRRPPWLQVDVGINAALGCGNVQPHSVPFIQFGVTRLNVLRKGAL